ncbi:peptide deformylase [bacterium]|nr:peptide deformylase [bacterium]
MAILKIVTDGNPILRRKCRPVSAVNKRIQSLLDDMLETMYDAPGVGLAAPQVGIPLRVIVMDVGKGPIKLVNPKVTYLSDEEVLDTEGCLSFPGLIGEVWRCKRVRVSGFNEFGEKVSYEGDDLFARCVQHECDHLDGRVYVDIAENVRERTSEDEEEAEEQEELETQEEPEV